MKIYAFDPGKNKDILCGEVIGDTFYRTANPDHYVLKYQGYGIQEEVIENFMKQGVTKIVITTKEGKKYKSLVEDWWNKGALDDLSNGKQIFLATENMTKE